MQSLRIALEFGLFLVIAGSTAAQMPSGQPTKQKPLNPTQEVAKEQAEGQRSKPRLDQAWAAILAGWFPIRPSGAMARSA